MNRIEKDRPEEEFAGIGVVEAADDVTAQGVALDATTVFRATALAAAIHRGNAEASAGVSEFIDPIAGVARVTVKLEDGGGFARGSRGGFGTQVFGVDAGAAYAGEPQIETLDVRRDDSGAGAEFGLRRRGVELAQGFSPIGIEVGGTGIAAGIAPKFGEREVDEGHVEKKEKARIKT